MRGDRQPMASSRPLHLVTAETVLQRFRECSEESRRELDKLRLPVGEHLLREDIPEALGRAAGRPLTGGELAHILQCFRMDVSASISLAEFCNSWSALQALAGGGGDAAAQAGKGQHAGAAGGRSRQQGPGGGCQPCTASAEIGWHHAAAPLPPRQRCEDPADRFMPIRPTDVTKGGEGTSAQSYFGLFLSKP